MSEYVQRFDQCCGVNVLDLLCFVSRMPPRKSGRGDREKNISQLISITILFLIMTVSPLKAN